MNSYVPILALVGRPNVGKSTLFNRLLGENRAVVEDIEGVTRDRNYALCERYSVPFYLVDTGGFDLQATDDITKQVVQQTRLAVEEAELLLVLFDGNSGAHLKDEDVVEMVRRSGKPHLFLVNKCDGIEQQQKVNDFYQLGVGELYDISALHGHNVRNMIEEALQKLPNYQQLLQKAREDREVEERHEANVEYELERFEEQLEKERSLPDDLAEPVNEVPDSFEFPPVLVATSDEEALVYEREFRLRPLGEEYSATSETEVEEDEELDEDEIRESETEIELPEEIRVAIIGRPNVGKSTLLNALVGEKRAIVSPISGTTRDSLDARVDFEEQAFRIVDTAGLRKRGRISESVEQFSTMRSIRAISECDVAAVLLDAVEGPTEQDAKIIGLAHDQGRGIVIVVNKWDLVEKDHRAVTNFKQRVRETFKFAPYAPLVFTSAISGRKCQQVLREAVQVARARLTKVKTGPLNRHLERSMKRVNAPTYRGRPVKLYFATQVAVAPPRFILFFNQPKGVHFSQLRFIKNSIRERFGFEGSDLKLMVRKRGAQEGEGEGEA